jgi:uncharacterized membrane protein SpoIIM required for sporulation/uncharacterized RDD family membrane protein YckC
VWVRGHEAAVAAWAHGHDIGPMSEPSQPRPRALDQIVDVETPEQVVFSYSVAGIGTRAAAALIDLLITFVLMLAILLALVVAGLSVAGRNLTDRMSEGWVIAIFLLVQFVVMWGYHFLFESFRDGQSPGKRMMRIRVVRDGGYSLAPGEAAIRNIMRMVDMMPPVTYAVGMLSAVLNRSGKRLGDIVAGTMVVQERLLLQQAPPPPDPDDDAIAGSAVLSEPEFVLLQQFRARIAGLSGPARDSLVAQLVQRFAPHLPPGETRPHRALAELFESEQRARAAGMAARGDVGAARERHAILREGRQRWHRFSTRLACAQRGGLRTMREEEVREFVAEYREVATDLARLRTAIGGAHSDEVFYLSRLVAAGHNLLYRRKPLSARAMLRYFTVTVPTEIRRSARPILAAAVLLFAPMVITYAAVMANPPLAERILPQGMFDRADEGLVRSPEGGGYIPVSAGERPILAAQVMTNNLQVTFLVFALGMTAAIGTVLVLVMNGISIGAAVGLYGTMGIAHLIMDFMIPHGVFELTAICLGGGAGFLLGRALLLPGALDRVSALRAQGRRAIDLIVAAALMLVLAGFIEGLISPRPELPAVLRYGVAVISGIIIVTYIGLGRGTPLDDDGDAQPAGSR